MPIPPEIQALVDQLNLELNQIEQETKEGLNLVRELLSRFFSNAILTQYFAYFNTALIFVETSRGQIQTTVETLSATDVLDEVIQDVGQDLSTLLGRVLEVKLKIVGLVERLEE